MAFVILFTYTLAVPNSKKFWASKIRFEIITKTSTLQIVLAKASMTAKDVMNDLN